MTDELFRKGERKGKGKNFQEEEKKRKGQREGGEGRKDRPFEGFERLGQRDRGTEGGMEERWGGSPACSVPFRRQCDQVRPTRNTVLV